MPQLQGLIKRGWGPAKRTIDSLIPIIDYVPGRGDIAKTGISTYRGPQTAGGGGGGGGGGSARGGGAGGYGSGAGGPYQAPTPTPRTPFSQIMPFGRIFDEGLIGNLANQQLVPEITRQRSLAMRGLGKNLALSGAYRTGLAPARSQRLMDQYSRQLAEQKGAFTGQVKDWATDWYNRQSGAYYKNPVGFVLPKVPTLSSYMKSKGMPMPGPTAPKGGLDPGYVGGNVGRAMKNIGLLSGAYKR